MGVAAAAGAPSLAPLSGVIAAGPDASVACAKLWLFSRQKKKKRKNKSCRQISWLCRGTPSQLPPPYPRPTRSGAPTTTYSTICVARSAPSR